MSSPLSDSPHPIDHYEPLRIVRAALLSQDWPTLRREAIEQVTGSRLCVIQTGNAASRDQEGQAAGSRATTASQNRGGAQ